MRVSFSFYALLTWVHHQLFISVTMLLLYVTLSFAQQFDLVCTISKGYVQLDSKIKGGGTVALVPCDSFRRYEVVKGGWAINTCGS